MMQRIPAAKKGGSRVGQRGAADYAAAVMGFANGGLIPIPERRDTSLDERAWRNTPGVNSLQEYQQQQVLKGAQDYNEDITRFGKSVKDPEMINRRAGLMLDAQALGAKSGPDSAGDPLQQEPPESEMAGPSAPQRRAPRVVPTDLQGQAPTVQVDPNTLSLALSTAAAKPREWGALNLDQTPALPGMANGGAVQGAHDYMPYGSLVEVPKWLKNVPITGAMSGFKPGVAQQVDEGVRWAAKGFDRQPNIASNAINALEGVASDEYRRRHGEFPEGTVPDGLASVGYALGKMAKQASDPVVIPLAMVSEGALPVMAIGALAGAAQNASTQQLGNGHVNVRGVLKNAVSGAAGALAGDFAGRGAGRGAVGELVGRSIASGGVSSGVENSAQAALNGGDEVTFNPRREAAGYRDGGPVNMAKGGPVPTAKRPGVDQVPALLDAPPGGPAEFVVPGDTVAPLDALVRQAGYKGGLDDFLKAHHDYQATAERKAQTKGEPPMPGKGVVQKLAGGGSVWPLFDPARAREDQAANRGNAYGDTNFIEGLQGAGQAVADWVGNLPPMRAKRDLAAAVTAEQQQQREAARPAREAQAAQWVKGSDVAPMDAAPVQPKVPAAMTAAAPNGPPVTLAPGAVGASPQWGVDPMRTAPKLPATEAQAVLSASAKSKPFPVQAVPGVVTKPASTTPASKPQTNGNALAFETSPESRAQYARQLTAAGGQVARRNGVDEYVMPADQPVTPQDLARQVRATGGGNKDAFNPANIAAAQAAAKAFTPDTRWNGYDLRGMTPAEVAMLKQQSAQEAVDLGAAQKYMAMPQNERGARTAAVQRGMQPGPASSQQYAAGMEGRAQAQRAGAGAEQAKLETDLVKQQLASTGQVAAAQARAQAQQAAESRREVRQDQQRGAADYLALTGGADAQDMETRAAGLRFIDQYKADLQQRGKPLPTPQALAALGAGFAAQRLSLPKALLDPRVAGLEGEAKQKAAQALVAESERAAWAAMMGQN